MTRALANASVPQAITQRGPIRSLGDAAAALGIEPWQLLKSLLMRRADEDYLLVLVPGDRAYEYYRGFLPAKYNDQAELHQVEPYVYCQFTHGPESPRFGQARNPWLTGTASWSYVGVTQYILGVRPELAGLRIDPCLPEGWDGFQMRRRFRGLDLIINVVNASGVATGVSSVTIDGVEVAAADAAARGALVPVSALVDGAVLTVTMG